MDRATRFGDWLRKTREAKGVSAYRLAQETGLTRGYISNLETGRKAIPSPDALEKIANVLGIPIAEITKEAMRDRLSDEELDAAAEAAMEEATPQEAVDAIKVWLRANDRDSAAKKAFFQEMGRVISENWDEMTKDG